MRKENRLKRIHQAAAVGKPAAVFMPGERRNEEWTIMNWSQPINWNWQKCTTASAVVGRSTPILSAGSSAPAAGACFTPSSTTGSTAMAKHAQGFTEESSVSRQGRTLYALAAESPSLPTARMPSSAATPAGKRPTGKAQSEKCQFGIFH